MAEPAIGTSTAAPRSEPPQHCQCGIVLGSSLSLLVGMCAACRLAQRSTLPSTELHRLAEEYQLSAARSRNARSWQRAADFEMEAQIVSMQLAQREALENE